MAAIGPPAVPAIYELLSTPQLAAIVMEPIRGQTLKQLLQERHGYGESASLGSGIEQLSRLGEVLRQVHDAGIAHGDLKPGNVLIGKNGRTTLIDFGLMRAQFDGGASSIKGTPAYIAPEIVLMERRKGAAHLADIYAFGVIAFQMLTGQLPFQADTISELLQQHAVVDPSRLEDLLPDAPSRLSDIIAAMLHKEPAERPTDLEWMLWELRRSHPTRPASLRPRMGFCRILAVIPAEPLRKAVLHALNSWTPEADVLPVGEIPKMEHASNVQLLDILLLQWPKRKEQTERLLETLRSAALRKTTTYLLGVPESSSDLSALGRLGICQFWSTDPESAEGLAWKIRKGYVFAEDGEPAPPPRR